MKPSIMQIIRYRFKCLLIVLAVAMTLVVLVVNMNFLSDTKKTAVLREAVPAVSGKWRIADFEDGRPPKDVEKMAETTPKSAEDDGKEEDGEGVEPNANEEAAENEEDDRPDVVKMLTPAPIPKDVKEDTRKLIYFASPFFGGPFTFNELPNECRTSSDPNDLKKADAVVVHALGGSPIMDMHSEDGRRKMGVPYDQVWVGLMYESPGIYSNLPGIYNYTMTFRRDSDVYSPYCGRFELAEKGKTISEQEPELEKMRLKRSKQVAWMVSNCHAANFRMDYAKELSQYISVDIYGACSPNGLRCVRFGSGNADRACWEMIASTYKFYLSFESSHCKDYITEKFFTPMYYGLVPIVYGGASLEDYQAMAPKHSYIDTRDYKSPKELAEYLKQLDKSPQDYGAYFNWRKRYMVHYNRTFVGQDILCSKLWNIDKFRHNYSEKELNTWWLEGGKCVSPPWKPVSVANPADRQILARPFGGV